MKIKWLSDAVDDLIEISDYITLIHSAAKPQPSPQANY